MKIVLITKQNVMEITMFFQLKHSAVKLWNCKQCGKQFTAKRYMMAHERRHTGARNYECDICKKTFVEKYKMVCHRSVRIASQTKYDSML